MAVWVVHTTAPDKKTASRFAQELVKRGLAACVTQAPGAVSTYRWKGKVARSKETLLVIKTSGSRLKKVLAYIEASHPYELPEAMALPVRIGSKKYLNWIQNSGL